MMQVIAGSVTMIMEIPIAGFGRMGINLFRQACVCGCAFFWCVNAFGGNAAGYAKLMMIGLEAFRRWMRLIKRYKGVLLSIQTL